MPDIAICNNQTCHLRHNCYRSKAIPCRFRQSYFAGIKPDSNGICEYFLPLVEIPSKEQNNQEQKITLYKFYIDAIQEMKKNKHLRYGQILFNKLVELRPDLSEKIRGTEYDPFYCESTDETKFHEFIKLIESNWKY
jgi:hypothetical protein